MTAANKSKNLMVSQTTKRKKHSEQQTSDKANKIWKTNDLSFLTIWNLERSTHDANKEQTDEYP